MNRAVLPDYAELHCLSNFSFLRGASHPEELVERAVELGYTALALTDECSVAGVVRAHIAAKERGLKLIIGAELRLEDGPRVVLLAANLQGYGNLCELITLARRAAGKGRYRACRADLEKGLPDCLALWLPDAEPDEAQAHWLQAHFRDRLWIALELHRGARDRERLRGLSRLSRRLKIPLVAAGDVHMHVRARRALQDTVTAIRLGLPIAHAGQALFPNGERHLRTRKQLTSLYPRRALAESLRIAARCRFSLDELRYEYPREWLPPGMSAGTYLRSLVEEGAARRWPDGVPARVRALIEHELVLITALRYEAYFLTVYDIVAFARSRGILCQGRGSAANSAVCFCLGITEVDPARVEVLFERFISKERNEPPDIDVDFEHERREEVLQYLYEKYGRERAALAATVITYRTRSAVRDVGKALGLDQEQIERAAKALSWWEGLGELPTRLSEAGFDADSPTIRRLLALTHALIGFPRHLSQHVGGMVMAHGKLSRMVPIENAAMAERTVIQWDKDDLDALGLLKVDCLALGMLSAVRRAFGLIERHEGRSLSMADIPAEDPAVYAMVQRADTVGVFQIESRAQMAMLPRLRPQTFYDLVIQIAIVRPGPIQGNMVHPYLRRRQGLEAVSYPSEEVRAVLERTLGVPIFQEQVIKLAMVAAGFTPGEADQLRRSMAAWRRKGGIAPFERRLIDGMRARGYSEQFARQVFEQIQGFGEYGFPESHSASFALLAYVSAWLKCRQPAAFACALLNSQPMGFYAPAQLVHDAQRHGVRVLPVDVRVSAWDCDLEPERDGRLALRLGLRLVKGLTRAGADALVAARRQATFADVADLARRARLTQRDLKALAAADALRFAGARRQAHWEVQGIEPGRPLLEEAPVPEALPLLPRATQSEEVAADYARVGFSLRRHPLALMRAQLAQERVVTAAALRRLPHGRSVRVAGLVITRQRPASASGVIFLTLEDETGTVNIVIWPDIAMKYRQALLGASLVRVAGAVQRQGEVIHIVARELLPLSQSMQLPLLTAASIRR